MWILIEQSVMVSGVVYVFLWLVIRDWCDWSSAVERTNYWGSHWGIDNYRLFNYLFDFCRNWLKSVYMCQYQCFTPLWGTVLLRAEIMIWWVHTHNASPPWPSSKTRFSWLQAQSSTSKLISIPLYPLSRHATSTLPPYHATTLLRYPSILPPAIPLPCYPPYLFIPLSKLWYFINLRNSHTCHWSNL